MDPVLILDWPPSDRGIKIININCADLRGSSENGGRERGLGWGWGWGRQVAFRETITIKIIKQNND